MREPKYPRFYLVRGCILVFCLGFAQIIVKVKGIKSMYFSPLKASDTVDSFEGTLA